MDICQVFPFYYYSTCALSLLLKNDWLMLNTIFQEYFKNIIDNIFGYLSGFPILELLDLCPIPALEEWLADAKYNISRKFQEYFKNVIENI